MIELVEVQTTDNGYGNDALTYGGLVVQRNGNKLLDLTRREAIRLRDLLTEVIDHRGWV